MFYLLVKVSFAYQMNEYQDFPQNGYPLFTAGH